MAGVQDAPLDETTLDRLTDRVVDAIADALARGEKSAAGALQLLLRRYATGARADLAEPLGAALALEADRQAQHGCDDDCEGWIALFSEAAAVSDDPRLPRAAADLLGGLRARWSNPAGNLGPVDEVMRSVEACLFAVNLPEAREMTAEAIDALERVVAGAYRPGQGVSHEIAKTPFLRGGLSDHVRAASALLTAYMLTARLPYAMLADELMQSVLRTPPSEPGGRAVPVAVNCELARVFCRLAALHRDEEYRRTAVLAENEDYAADAARTLAALASSVRERGGDAALFGLALAEYLEVR